MKPSSSQQTQTNSYQSVEQSIIQKYLEHIDRLPPLWLESENMDKRKFSLQLEFIISMIPFVEVRTEIKKERAKLETEYKASKDEAIRKDAELRAGFAAVTGVMGFIFDKFDLVHEDIMGAGTSREYQKKIIEVPDLPEDRIKALTEKAEP